MYSNDCFLTAWISNFTLEAVGDSNLIVHKFLCDVGIYYNKTDAV